VNGADFNLFAAIVGSQPIMEPQAAERAAAEEIQAAATPPPPEQLPEKHLRVRIPAPAEVVEQVRRVYHRGFTLRIRKPQLAQWVREISDVALRRLEEAHARFVERPAPQREEPRQDDGNYADSDLAAPTYDVKLSPRERAA